ncbi:hypothetical protein AURDEDRAFT_178267 [Auricularia subglabra TFB-10046 SS5]|uniref:BRCT domain-containing protein n=1 Tax=Auricularia subglabra (strain TFB-10046 / SS5) TaxID=717982 RepID=J0WK25_AURST|nr:hypothetical protein AURDEDRAFT_178267 [Auricularia subglabra TFB-10046 SS5]
MQPVVRSGRGPGWSDGASRRLTPKLKRASAAGGDQTPDASWSIAVPNTYLDGRAVYVDRTVYCQPNEKKERAIYLSRVPLLGASICENMNDADVILAHEHRTRFDIAYSYANLPVLACKYVDDCLNAGEPMPVNNYLIIRFEGNRGRVLEDGGVAHEPVANRNTGRRAVRFARQTQSENSDNDKDTAPEVNAGQQQQVGVEHRAVVSPAPISVTATESGRSSHPNRRVSDGQGAHATGSNARIANAAISANEASDSPPLPKGKLDDNHQFRPQFALDWGEQFVLWYLLHTKKASPTNTIRGASSLVCCIVTKLSTHTYENTVGRTPTAKKRVKRMIEQNAERAGEKLIPRTSMYQLACEARLEYKRTTCENDKLLPL